MVHQSPSSSRVFVEVMQALGRDRSVVAADTPGFGESTAPSAEPTISDYADAHLEALNAVTSGPIDLFGYYTGARVAVELALRLEGRIRHLALLGAPMYTEEEKARLESLHRPWEVRADGSHLIDWWNHSIDWWNGKLSPALTHRDLAEAMRPDPRIVGWGHNAAFAYPLEEKLPMVSQPLLLMTWDDPLREPVLRTAERLGVEAHALDGTHATLHDSPEQLAGVLRDFFDDR